MSEFIQIHGLFDYGFSNPNRDRDNEPKRVMIGNVDRQRISSQCLKRTWRTSDLFVSAFGGKLGEGNLGIRTKESGLEILAKLEEGGLSEALADQWTRIVVAVFGAAKPEKKDTQDHLKNETLFFATPEERRALHEFLDEIVKNKTAPPNVKGKEELEKEAAKIRSKILRKETTAVDVAMFGRMFAQDKDYSIEGCVQVNHAFTVAGMEPENDFFVAVDDVKSSDEARGEDRGGGHLGSFTMGAGVYYKYASLNRTALLGELKDEALTRKACEVFVETFMTVFARAKGNSCAQQSLAFYGRVERGQKMPRNLQLAYLEAIRDKNVDRVAIERIQKTAQSMNKVYGERYSEMKEFIALPSLSEGALPELLAVAGR